MLAALTSSLPSTVAYQAWDERVVNRNAVGVLLASGYGLPLANCFPKFPCASRNSSQCPTASR
eukprot:15442675-Alexandrium_andersonii.AAC.1